MDICDIKKIPAFVINLAERKDRRESVIKQLDNVESIRYKIITVTRHPDPITDNKNTHIFIYERALKCRTNYFLVFEDDFQLAMNFEPDFWKRMEYVPEDADMILLGALSVVPYLETRNTSENKKNKNYLKINRFTGLHACLFRRNRMREIITYLNFHIENTNNCIDFLLSDLVEKCLINAYVIIPFLCHIANLSSDITAGNSQSMHRLASKNTNNRLLQINNL